MVHPTSLRMHLFSCIILSIKIKANKVKQKIIVPCVCLWIPNFFNGVLYILKLQITMDENPSFQFLLLDYHILQKHNAEGRILVEN